MSTKIVIMSIILAIIFPLQHVFATSAESGPLYSQNDRPFGQSFGDWSIKWWSWLMSMPSDKTAMNDFTGELCGEKQNDKNVFYLAGPGPASNYTRNCDVPSGKALLFVDGNECNHGEYKKYENEDIKALETCAIDGNKLGDGGYLSAKLDGIPLTYLPTDNVTAGPFLVNITDNFVFGFEYEGLWNAIANSYVLFLKPLPKGDHQLIIEVLHKAKANDIPYNLVFNLSVS